MRTRARTPARTSIWWLVLISAAVLLTVLLSAPSGTAGDVPTVNLSGEVTRDMCTPCHARIADVANERIRFSHGTHITVGCASCHSQMPHREGTTEIPEMGGCFACHGFGHAADSTVAGAACDVCHSSGFELRPATHVADWPLAPHAEEARSGGVNQCMLCHDAPLDCDACHVSENVDVGPMPPFFLPTLPVVEERPELTIEFSSPISIGQCIHCHGSVGEFLTDRLIFPHEVHIERNYSCASCHPVFPHSAFGTAYNTMADCYRCHSLVHADKGLVATEDCLACHPTDFDLVPLNHTGAFVNGDHGWMVEEDEKYCSLCHKSDFCVPCHRNERSMPDGTSARWVIPEDHTESVWLSQHGPIFLDATGTCYACHDSPSCERCHFTPMPHPVDFLALHGEDDHGSPEERDCAVCHVDRSWCQDCHHDQAKGDDLIEENCDPCHTEMSLKPATAIKHKSYAYHAVHFEVEESVGRPYRCYECHATWGRPTGNGNGNNGRAGIRFGNDNGHTGSPDALGHDLRLCYDCHGGLDFQNELIAPWPGAQLCVRCHPDFDEP